MSLSAFDTLPDQARMWCFAADRYLDPTETARLLDAMEAFLDGWTAHGADLSVSLGWRYDRFLLVAVDESAAGASGCSIDALTRRLGELESELGVRLRDASPVWFRDPEDADRVACASRKEFRDMAGNGRVDGSTTVFDLTVERVGELRRGRWELPAREAWHAALLPVRARDSAARAGGRAGPAS
ncbi:MAG TPA: hypothetical protein VKB18_06440 [Gemmatimonadota bacterium]|nr:hypothetical protein [Gemmatimonadota bacterium]